MRIVVISTQNSLLSGAIVKYLLERGELHPERVEKEKAGDASAICLALNADVLLMEATRLPPFDFESRMRVTRDVKRKLPHCKVALLCDENADPALAEQITQARRLGQIDSFFYSSVSGDYLAAALDTL